MAKTMFCIVILVVGGGVRTRHTLIHIYSYYGILSLNFLLLTESVHGILELCLLRHHVFLDTRCMIKRNKHQNSCQKDVCTFFS